MHLHATAFWVPKAGNQDSEYEDAYCPIGPIDAEGASLSRFAVADGATETSFSRLWAKQLVEAYIAGEFEKIPDWKWLAELQEKWSSTVNSKPLPWYAEQKIESGAFAAVVGLTLTSPEADSQAGTWHAEAIGDSCLFQIRDSQIVTKFPLGAAEEFTNSPTLIASKPGEASGLASLVLKEGGWECGDQFYLMTDAVAAWFLWATENSESPWEIVRDLDAADEATAGKFGLRSFRQWVDCARAQGLMRNDDVTLYRIEIA